jgi:hypothetical protein
MATIPAFKILRKDAGVLNDDPARRSPSRRRITSP